MNNYDFKSLNDKEFEALACDLLGRHLGKRFERFKSGPDGGVDGRFFLSENREVVLQCKHWANTPIAQLLNRLSKSERPKIAKLKAEQYFIAVTNSLSRNDKKKIRISLSPHIKSDSFIYGAEDLNDLLSQAKDIEQRHYKLWLHSTNVISCIMNHAILGRSAHTVEEIKTDTARYAITENHHRALAQLENLGVIIITGEPGIGKTTLANHLSLHYVAQGYQFVVISDDVIEAEKVLDLESKQIFYFDDFLGRNYLDALNGHEGKKITKFIKIILKNKSKKFVLTSRSTILNQGKLLIDMYSHDNLQRNEYELKISSLSAIDKAHILYNQIWHSQLNIAYVNEIYKDGRYRNILLHKNYNPRLVNYVTDASRLENIAPNMYWRFIEGSLSNPAEIWDNPFTAQQDDFGRAIVLLVVLNRQPIMEDLLAKAYYEYISLPGNQNMKGRSDFINNLKTLTGSLLNRIVEGVAVKIDLFNPSIGDYVLERYKSDPSAMKMGFICLRNKNAMATLKSLARNKMMTLKNVEMIATAMLERTANNEFLRLEVSFLAELIRYVASFKVLEQRTSSFLKNGVRFILDRTEPTHSTSDAFSVIKLGVERHWITNGEALQFVDGLAHFLVADEEIEECWKLVSSIEKTGANYDMTFGNVIGGISDHIANDVPRFIDVASAFADCDPFDYDCATKTIEKTLVDKLTGLGLNINDFNIDYLTHNFDIKRSMENYFENLNNPHILEDAAPIIKFSSDAQIDDLFERS
jgi:adenylate kinase family enzyme